MLMAHAIPTCPTPTTVILLFGIVVSSSATGAISFSLRVAIVRRGVKVLETAVRVARRRSSLHSSIKIATAHRKAVKARQKGDRGPAVFGGSETAAASGWLHSLGSVAGTGRGGCKGAMLDPLSLSEVQGTGCMCSWLGKMPQTPFFQQEGETQGEGRGPQSLPRPPHAQQGSQSRDHPSPGRVHSPQEPARLHSQGCIHMA